MNSYKRTIALLLTVVLSICIGSYALTKHANKEPVATTIESYTELVEENGTTGIIEKTTIIELTEKASTTKENKAKKESTSAKLDTTAASTKASTTVKASTKATTNVNATSTTKASTSKVQSTTKPATTHTTTSTTAVLDTCVITIQCKSVLENEDKLKDGHSKYVPNDGVILRNYRCKINDGDTVYDVLKEACEKNNIKLTTKSSAYGVYIVGINNIDEKDCGPYSGWMYKVNRKYPSVSVDKTFVDKNDSIEFEFTC